MHDKNNNLIKLPNSVTCFNEKFDFKIKKMLWFKVRLFDIEKPENS